MKDEFCIECEIDYKAEGLPTPCDNCPLEFDLDEEDEEEEEPEAFFCQIPRCHSMFKQPILFITPDGVEQIDKPDDLLVCDVCNKEIKSDLIYCATFSDGYSIWGAYCEECKEKYQPTLPIYPIERMRCLF